MGSLRAKAHFLSLSMMIAISAYPSLYTHFPRLSVALSLFALLKPCLPYICPRLILCLEGWWQGEGQEVTGFGVVACANPLVLASV